MTRPWTSTSRAGEPTCSPWTFSREEYADVADPKWRYPKREGPSRRYVAECVKRYGSHAAFIELYNEPDIRDFWRGRPEQYVEWARWAIIGADQTGKGRSIVACS